MKNKNTIEAIECDIIRAKQYLKDESDEQIFALFHDLQDKYKTFGYEEIKVSDYAGYSKDKYKINYKFEYYKYFLKTLVKKLEFLKAHLSDENDNLSDSPNIINNISNTANSTINQNFDFKTTIKNINKIPNEILDEKLKTELLGILTEIEHADEKESKKEKFMKAIKWLGNKSVDVAIQILPYLAGIKF